MSERILKVSDDFWNIRGVFKIGGLVNIGTHASLVQRASGKFLLLDAYTLDGAIKERIDARTGGGSEIEAIINLHPFHTVHTEPVHRQYPNARLYGTARHHRRFPDLPWQPERSESPECAALFADDLEFSVPRGVEFIPRNENLHFSSVLAYHRASKTLHVDDTLNCINVPGLPLLMGRKRKPDISFHPTLSRTLERRAGAAGEFRQWAQDLAGRWGDAENLCAAHSSALIGRNNRSASVKERMLDALHRVEKKLSRHEAKYG